MPRGLATPTAFAGPIPPDPNAPPPALACRQPAPGAALLVLLAAASPAITATDAVSPDAGLLRLCASFHDADARCNAAPDDGMTWRTWLGRRWGFSAAIADTPARTEAGILAKARVALVLMEEAADTANEYERTILAVLRDLAGSAGA